MSVSRVPGPPPRTSTPPRLPAGGITTVQPVAPSRSVQWPIENPSGGAIGSLTPAPLRTGRRGAVRRRGRRRRRRWQEGQK